MWLLMIHKNQIVTPHVGDRAIKSGVRTKAIVRNIEVTYINI